MVIQDDVTDRITSRT